MSSRRAENRHRRLRGKRGTGGAERTLITANRAGQIGNDVIKMRAGGQRKIFVPVQRRSKVIARLCEKSAGKHLGAQHNAAALFTVKASRFRRWFERSSFRRALAAYEYITDSSAPPVTTVSAPHGRLHRRNGNLQNSKPLSLTFCARADIMRIRIKSRRPFTASEVISSPKRTRRASDSKVLFLGCLVLVGLSSLQVRRPYRFVVLSGSSSSRVRCSLGFDALAGSSSTRGRILSRFFVIRAQFWSASFLYCRARHGISAGTYLYPFAFVSP